MSSIESVQLNGSTGYPQPGRTPVLQETPAEMKRSETGWLTADLWRADHYSSIMACQHHPEHQQAVEEKNFQAAASGMFFAEQGPFNRSSILYRWVISGRL